MRRLLSFVILACLLAGILAACSAAASPTAPAATPPPAATAAPSATPQPTASPAVAAILAYLNAVVNKDVDKVSTLACADFEQMAVQEVDSLQAVTAKLSPDLACAEAGTDGANTLVHCQGKMLITYNSENQELDLSARTYEVSQSGGDWLMCGYKQ